MNAAKLLDSLNISKGDDEEEKTVELMFDEEKSQILLEYILETLHRIFMHDAGQGFVNKERFDALLLPICNQVIYYYYYYYYYYSLTFKGGIQAKGI